MITGRSTIALSSVTGAGVVVVVVVVTTAITTRLTSSFSNIRPTNVKLCCAVGGELKFKKHSKSSGSTTEFYGSLAICGPSWKKCGSHSQCNWYKKPSCRWIADRAGCQWPSRLSKVDDIHFIWKPICDFVSMINSNLGPILHRLTTIHLRLTNSTIG